MYLARNIPEQLTECVSMRTRSTHCWVDHRMGPWNYL